MVTGQCEACGQVGPVVEEHFTPLGADGPGGVLCEDCELIADELRQRPELLAYINRADAAALAADEA